jgi:hypothetical protein
VTCETAASACGFRCSSNRSAGSRLRQAGACWTAAPGTSIRHEQGRQHSMRTNRPPSLVIAGVGRPPRGRLLRRTVTDGSRLLLHPADGPLLGHRANGSATVLANPSHHPNGRAAECFLMLRAPERAPNAQNNQLWSQVDCRLRGGGVDAHLPKEPRSTSSLPRKYHELAGMCASGDTSAEA